MPLIIITGYPCSGKSFRAKQLENYFKSIKNIETMIIADSMDIHKNLLYTDSQKEKNSRSSLKSSIQRSIDKEKLIICDSLNYIKGFRYELFCIVKAAQTTKCLVYCSSSRDKVFLFNEQQPDNEKYDPEILDGLIQRYEPPDSNNKWDFPLFTVSSELINFDNWEKSLVNMNLNAQSSLAEDLGLPFEEIYNCLYKSKPLPPNLSTLPQALSSNNFLNELDTMTQDVVKEYMDVQRHCLPGEQIKLCGGTKTAGKLTGDVPTETVVLLNNAPSSSLLRLRRQFINYTRQHPPVSEQPGHIRQLFIQFLRQRIM